MTVAMSMIAQMTLARCLADIAKPKTPAEEPGKAMTVVAAATGDPVSVSVTMSMSFSSLATGASVAMTVSMALPAFTASEAMSMAVAALATTMAVSMAAWSPLAAAATATQAGGTTATSSAAETRSRAVTTGANSRATAMSTTARAGADSAAMSASFSCLRGRAEPRRGGDEREDAGRENCCHKQALASRTVGHIENSPSKPAPLTIAGGRNRLARMGWSGANWV